MEHIKVNGDASSWFAIMALTLHEEKTKQLIPNIPEMGLNVELKLNGVEVSFIETVNELIQQYEAQLDKLAAKKALQVCQLNGLQELINKVKNVEWEIRGKIEQVFDVDLGD